MRQLRLLIPLLWLAFAPAAHAQQRLTQQQEKSLAAFARLFGYVRYFHPSDEAQTISWPMLATKGSRQMLAVRNDAELIQTLNELFQPLGPTIRVFPTSQPVPFDPAALRPPAAAQASWVVSWQHEGIYTENYAGCKNVRLGRPRTETSTYSLLENTDVRRFAGLPYEIELTWTVPKEAEAIKLTATQRQTLAGRTTQPPLNQTSTVADTHYLFKGKIDAATQQLTISFTVPADFNISLTTKAFVLTEGKRVELAASAGSAEATGAGQTVDLAFSSPEVLALPLFQTQSQLGDCVARELVPGISCTVPLALVGDAAHTYPLGDSLKLNALHVRPADRARYPAEWLRYQGERTLGLPEVRLADVVESWNALRHGYAYWGSASVPPDTLLHQTLRRAYADNTTVGFVRIMRLMMAALNDGHAWVTTTFDEPSPFTAPLAFVRAAGQVVVAKVLQPATAPQVRRGDILEAVDGVPVEQVLAERARYVSGSPQMKERQALPALASSAKDLPAVLRLRRGDSLYTSSVPRTVHYTGYSPPARPNGWLVPGIYYYNLATMKEELSASEFQTLAQAKAIIFDIRNYPEGHVSTLIPLLLKTSQDITLLSSLHMLRPDQEDMRYAPDVVHYAPGPRHLPGRTYFLTDAVTQSRPETFLGWIRGLHLGTLVGRPTSGANGSRNELALQGGLSIGYSSERVLNADGSRHHTIGIVPDVLVTPTMESMRLGQDEILNAALKLAQGGK